MKIAAMRQGPIKGGRTIAFMLQWAIWRESTGQVPRTITEDVQAYADWWRDSERTAWRDVARFREAFPGELTPDRILDLVADQLDRREGVRGLGSLSVPSGVLA
jgi:hypothetical protein